jgi:transposase
MQPWHSSAGHVGTLDPPGDGLLLRVAQGLAATATLVQEATTLRESRWQKPRCSANTVSKWRKRFVEHRLDGLLDDDRPGRPRTISVDQVEDVIVATLESTPPNATHWTRSKMAEGRACRRPRSGTSGKTSASSPTRSTTSSCPPIPCSSTRTTSWRPIPESPCGSSCALC